MVLALALGLVATSAQADVLIPNGAGGLYNSGLGDFGADPFLNNPAQNGQGGVRMFLAANVTQGDPNQVFTTAPNFSGASASILSALGSWLSNPAAPGGTWASVASVTPNWAVNTETAIIYTLDGGAGGLANVVLSVGVDNGVFVWVDGVFRFGATAPGGASPGEYTVNIGALSSGLHHVQVLRTDHGSATDFHLQVTGDRLPARIPEPATLLVIGTALLGLGLIGRRARA
jgi:hypothetical protein